MIGDDAYANAIILEMYGGVTVFHGTAERVPHNTP